MIATLVPSFFDERSNIPWKNFLDFAITHKLCLYGWPEDTVCPGPNWVNKKVVSSEMVKQIEIYEKSGMNSLGVFSVGRWNKGM